MALKVYYDKDADKSLILNKKIGILGYGSQAHAHAQNLRDSGAKNIKIALKDGSKSKDKAIADGFEVDTVPAVSQWGDVLMILAPDEVHASLWKDEIAPNIRPGTSLAVAHGFSVHFGYITPKEGVDIFMVAPKGPGHTVRAEYLSGGGVPCLVATSDNSSPSALPLAISYAACIGGGKSGIIETNLKDECETDLFGEQAVLCGGVLSLVRAGFDTLTEAGYPEEMAYFECVHELKLIVDLIYQGGMEDMLYSVSNTAEYGAYSAGPKVVNYDQAKKSMLEVLKHIQSGGFAKEWMAEHESGARVLQSKRKEVAESRQEVVGKKLRSLMPWIQKNKLIKGRS